jgi:hypothetical protein
VSRLTHVQARNVLINMYFRGRFAARGVRLRAHDVFMHRETFSGTR